MGSDTSLKIKPQQASQNIDELCEVMCSQLKSIVPDDLIAIFVTRADQGLHLKGKVLSGWAPQERVVCLREHSLVGEAARRCEVMVMNKPYEQPTFFLATHPEVRKIQTMVCFPIISKNYAIGVVALMRTLEASFTEDELDRMATSIEHYRFQFKSMQSLYIQGYEYKKFGKLTDIQDLKMKGVGVSAGIVKGQAIRWPHQNQVFTLPHGGDSADEWQQLKQAIDSVISDLATWKDFLTRQVSGSGTELFDAYVRILEGDDLKGKLKAQIYEQKQSASGAVHDVLIEYIKNLKATSDPIIRERAHDLQDLMHRVINRINGADREMQWPDQVILVGDLITATQLLEVPQKHLAGIICARGNSNSHVAILSRELGVPCVMNCPAIISVTCERLPILLDGQVGQVVVAPSVDVEAQFNALIAQEGRLNEALDQVAHLPAQTLDGYGLHLYINIGLANDIESALCLSPEGVGLFRTEIPFLAKDYFPSEKEQEKLYHNIAASFAPKPVFIRTLDTGGDKPLPYFHPQEDNPFLGWRGIRVCLSNPEIFRIQVRALLKAHHVNHNIRIMLPMITTIGEFKRAKEIILDCYHVLQESLPDLGLPPIGMMVEVPAVVLMIDEFMQHVDFVSIGSNDLTQYLLAVDRNNNLVSHLYNHLHPVVLRSLQKVVASGQRHQKHVSICGEMAADPLATVLLVAMGFDMLSLSASCHAKVKWVMRRFAMSDCKDILTRTLQCEEAKEVMDIMRHEFLERGLGGMLRQA